MDKSTFGLPKGSVRGAIALLLTGSVVYLVARDGTVCDGLSTLMTVVVSFYFGTKVKES